LRANEKQGQNCFNVATTKSIGAEVLSSSSIEADATLVNSVGADVVIAANLTEGDSNLASLNRSETITSNGTEADAIIPTCNIQNDISDGHYKYIKRTITQKKENGAIINLNVCCKTGTNVNDVSMPSEFKHRTSLSFSSIGDLHPEFTKPTVDSLESFNDLKTLDEGSSELGNEIPNVKIYSSNFKETLSHKRFGTPCRTSVELDRSPLMCRRNIDSFNETVWTPVSALFQTPKSSPSVCLRKGVRRTPRSVIGHSQRSGRVRSAASVLVHTPGLKSFRKSVSINLGGLELNESEILWTDSFITPVRAPSTSRNMSSTKLHMSRSPGAVGRLAQHVTTPQLLHLTLPATQQGIIYIYIAEKN